MNTQPDLFVKQPGDPPQFAVVRLVGHVLHGKRCEIVDRWEGIVWVKHKSLPEPIGFHPSHLI